MQDLIRTNDHYIAIQCDESDDPRPVNGYVLTLDLTLIPKVTSADDKLDVQTFHCKLDFPSAVNGESLSVFIDQVPQDPTLFFWEISPFQGLRELYVQPKDVIYFIHDSASYMNPAAERLKQDFGYSNMVHVPCWSHLLALIGKPIFDQKLLPELSEYLRLSKYVLW